MMEGLNIADVDVLMEFAADVSQSHPQLFKMQRFEADLGGDDARQASR
jgi:putative protein-disulfide isomerase